MSELRAPFRRQRDTLCQTVEDAEGLRTGLAEQKAHLPELRKTCEADIFPQFRNWTADLRRAVLPLDIKPLRRKARSLQGLLRLVLTNGRAMRILTGNLLLRLGLVAILLGKLGLVILILWGAVKLGEPFM